MKKKSKLFISGRISDLEVARINQEFQNEEFDITKYSQSGASISGIHDILRLIFEDFNPISFTRDILLGKFVEFSYSKLLKVITDLRRREKVITEIAIQREYHKSDGSVVFINFHARPEKFDILIHEVNHHLSFEFFEGIKRGKNVSVTLDINGKLEIQVD
jgi:hypothetical protein